SIRYGRRWFFRSGVGEALPGRLGVAIAALHDGGSLAGRSLGAKTRTLLRAGAEVPYSGPPGRRRLAGTQRQWPPGLRARAGSGDPAGLDLLVLREAGAPAPASQRDLARGSHAEDE